MRSFVLPVSTNAPRPLTSVQAVAALWVLLSATHSPAALADVWKYVDANGVTHFTNQPPPKNAELIIESSPAAMAQKSRVVRDDEADAAAHRTVARMNSSPAYLAVQDSLATAAAAHGVDHELLKAVISTESAFNPQAVSHKGAVGLMQIMPATARRYGVQSEPGITIAAKLADPELNIRTGTRYLADLLRMFGTETELAVAAYNAGEGAVVRAGNRIPRYTETQQYVKRVMSVYRALKK